MARRSHIWTSIQPAWIAAGSGRIASLSVPKVLFPAGTTWTGTLPGRAKALTSSHSGLYLVPVMLPVGSIAPSFTLPLISGGEFDLSEHRGRNIVIYFFLRAFTYG